MLDEVQVIFFSRVDLAAQGGRQGMVFVQHDRNLTVFGAEYKLDMQLNQSPETLLDSFNAGCVDAAHNIDHARLGDIHSMRHDVKQDLVFRLKMVIEAAFGEFER